MINENQYFLLYSNCIPVKGAKRSIICDLQLGRIKYIPNLLYDVLMHTIQNKISEIKKIFQNEIDNGIDTYFENLSKNGWGFYIEDSNNFPLLDLNWSYPGAISNAILDINPFSNYDITNVINQLSNLGCSALQVRFYKTVEIDELEKIILACNNTVIRFIEIVFQYDEIINEDILLSLFKKNYRVRSYIITNAPFEKEYQFGENIETILIRYKKNIINSHHNCGEICFQNFAVNIGAFREAINFNSCLNRKIGIDAKGAIKNCPSMPYSFGNINSVKIKDVLSNEDFKKIWNVTKDQITTCSDCEYRYICTDCRAYYLDNNNPFSKPLKCNYDPYTTNWHQ